MEWTWTRFAGRGWVWLGFAGPSCAWAWLGVAGLDLAGGADISLATIGKWMIPVGISFWLDLLFDPSFDGISFGISFGMGRAGWFMLVLHSG